MGSKRKRRKPKGPAKIRLYPERHGPIGEEFTRFMEPCYAGQPRFVEYGTHVLDRAHVGYQRKKRPLCVAMLIGCPGTGKTEFVKLFTKFLLDDEDAMLRLDGQEYAERHRISKILHPPPGYIGSEKERFVTQEKLDKPAYDLEAHRFRERITKEEWERFTKMGEEHMALMNEGEVLRRQWTKVSDQKKQLEIQARVEEINNRLRQITQVLETMGYPFYDPDRKQYFSVLLIDEIERAHEDFWEILLRIMDEGILENSMGEIVSFRRTFIFMTSNLGREEISKRLKTKAGKSVAVGFTGPEPQEEIAQNKASDLALFRHCRDEAHKTFGAPFMRRVDKVLFARPLSSKEIEKIFAIELREMREYHEREFPIFVHIGAGVRDFVVKEATDQPDLGASLLAEKFKRYIEGPLEDLRASGQIEQGDVIEIEYNPQEGKKGKEALRYLRAPREEEEKKTTIYMPPSA